DAPARRRRRLPLRVGLAGRHQRHAGDDRVQLEGGRLPAHDGRARADADTRDHRRPRGEDPRVHVASLLGAHGDVRRQGWRVRRTLVRRGVQEARCGVRWSGRRSRSSAERIWDEAKARAIAAACAGKRGTVSEESKPSTQIAPLLYDLTSLQREANGRFGFSARTTLSLAQALYEKHKALTYPRTDSRALPEDYLATVKATLEELGATGAYGAHARNILKNKWVRPNKRIFDITKIS